MTRSTQRLASTSLIVTLAAVSLGWYVIFLFSPAFIDNTFPYVLLLIAETIGMIQLFGVWLTVIIGNHEQETSEEREFRRQLKHIDPENVPEDLVAAFITVVDEPLDIVRKTIIATRDMDVPHQTYVLDDGPSDELKAMAEELGVGYFRREDREGRKAGNVNNALRQTDTQFFCIFDADHVPKKHFLIETLPVLLADEEVAFVQTPQYYGNRTGMIDTGAAELHEAFYRHVQGSKNSFNSAFCVGTNVIFRRGAIDELGGMYQASNSEDIWTSILLHERGWKSRFIAEVLAIGMGPETVGDYLRQQFRWARGGLEIFFHHNPFFQKGLNLDQKLQYFHATSYYLSGVSVLIFFLLPLIYAYMGLKPLQMLWPMEWVFHFIPYFAMMLITGAHLLGRWPKWATYVVALGAFPAHLGALFAVLTGFNIQWSVTGVIRKQSDYISAVGPQILLLLFSITAIPLIFLRSEDLSVALIVSGWLVLASAILFAFCREAFPRLQRARRQEDSPQLLTHSLS